MCVILLILVYSHARLCKYPVRGHEVEKHHLEGKHVQATLYFPVCPRSRRRSWSRETRSAGSSRVSLLILQTQAEFGAYSRYSSRSTAALYGCFHYRLMEISCKLMSKSSPWSEGRKTPSGREERTSYSSRNTAMYVSMVITCTR